PRRRPGGPGPAGPHRGGVDMIVKRMIECPGTFRCIGEVMSRHDDLTNLTSGDRPRVNHPALFRVFDFAGEFDIPVSLHHNITAISRGDDVKEPLYLEELLQTFQAFPGTQFIWCHAGISRRLNVEGMPAILDGVLAEHKDHVRIDLSWVVYGDYVKADWDNWLALIEKYPNNFLVGSDQVGSYTTYSETVRDYDELLKKLSRSTRDKVGRTNLLELFSSEAPMIPRDYRYPEDRYTRVRTPQP
ncbi:MAG: amidohydrolase family protein, partial [Verrucomicrobiota bacterium]|nr:amidohydrolase family protein [Verrucomicrobiota bacterium]